MEAIEKTVVIGVRGPFFYFDVRMRARFGEVSVGLGERCGVGAEGFDRSLPECSRDDRGLGGGC